MPRRIQSALALFAGLLTAGAVLAPAAASAQVNIDQDKTPAHIFASDCSVCHKSIRGLANGKGHAALAAFLAEHYTSSDAEAEALASYVLANGGGVGSAAPARDALLGSKRGAGPERSDHREAGAAKPKARPAPSAKLERHVGEERKPKNEGNAAEAHKPGEKRTADEKRKAKLARQRKSAKKRITEDGSRPKEAHAAVDGVSHVKPSRELPLDHSSVRSEPKMAPPSHVQSKHEEAALPAHVSAPVGAAIAPVSNATAATTHAPSAATSGPVKPSGAAPSGDNIPD